LDTLKESSSKYGPSVRSNVAVLQKLGCRPLFGVDATRLADDESVRGALAEASSSGKPVFDTIVFNFPHTGGAKAEDIVRNRDVVRGFLQQGAKLLRLRGGKRAGRGAGVGARILVALRKTPFYDGWRVDVLGQEARLAFAGEAPFVGPSLPGYNPVRTHPATREAPGASTDDAPDAPRAVWFTFHHSNASATSTRRFQVEAGIADAARPAPAPPAAPRARPKGDKPGAAGAKGGKGAAGKGGKAVAGLSKAQRRAAKRGRPGGEEAGGGGKRGGAAITADPEAEAALAAVRAMRG